MYIVCKNADFSACGIGQIDFRELDPEMEILFGPNALDSSLSKTQKLKLQDFIDSLKTAGIWSKIKRLYVPLYSASAANALVDVKETYDNQVVLNETAQMDTTITANANGGYDIAGVSYTKAIPITMPSAGASIFGSVLSTSTGAINAYKSNSDRIYYASNQIRFNMQQGSLNVNSNCFVGSFDSSKSIAVNNGTIVESENTASSSSYKIVIAYTTSESASADGTKMLGCAEALTSTEATALYNAISAFIAD